MQYKQKYKQIFQVITIIQLSFLGVFLSIGNIHASEINLKNVVELTNRSRSQENLKPLLINPILNKVAQDKALDMIKNHYFSHTSPAGVSPWHWFDQNNYNYIYAGENLATNYQNAKEEHSAWMASPTHRKNILNKNYTEIGIATIDGIIEHKPAKITVQVFGSPAKNYVSQVSGISSIDRTSSLNQTQVHYLTSISPGFSNSKQITQTISTKKSNVVISELKKQSRTLLWIIILFLGVLIVRDFVLESIITTKAHRPSVTNLILLIMLWSILVGI